MLAIKYVLLLSALSLFLFAAGIVAHDLHGDWRNRRKAEAAGKPHTPEPIRWRTSVALALLAWLPLLVAFSFALVPGGHARVRVSQNDQVRLAADAFHERALGFTSMR